MQNLCLPFVSFIFSNYVWMCGVDAVNICVCVCIFTSTAPVNSTSHAFKEPHCYECQTNLFPIFDFGQQLQEMVNCQIQCVYGLYAQMKVIITLCVAVPEDEMLWHDTFVYYLHAPRPLMRHRRRLILSVCFFVPIRSAAFAAHPSMFSSLFECFVSINIGDMELWRKKDDRRNKEQRAAGRKKTIRTKELHTQTKQLFC